MPSEDDNTIQEWINSRVKNSDGFDDAKTPMNTNFVATFSLLLFIWAILLCVGGLCCCCCSIFMRKSMWCIGAQSIALGILLVNWHIGQFPIALVFFVILSLWLLMQSVQRFRGPPPPVLNCGKNLI